MLERVSRSALFLAGINSASLNILAVKTHLALPEPASASALYRWQVLVVTSIAFFMIPFDASVVNLALPAIGESLHVSIIYLIWIPTAYLVVIASLETTMGKLIDMSGKRRLFLFALTTFTAGSLIAGLSLNIDQLIAARIIQGLGGAGMDAAGTSLLADAFRASGRGRAFGLNQMIVYVGSTVGPVAGGFLVQSFGWRSIFYVNLPVGVIAVLLTMFSIKKDQITRQDKESGRNFDLLGAFTLGSFLSTLLLILNQGDISMSPFIGGLLDGACVASLVAFVCIEARVAAFPLLDLKLFTRNRLFAGGMATSFANYSTSSGTLFVLSMYLQTVLGYSPINAGLILLTQPIFMAISSPISGTLSERASARVLCSVGMLSRAVGFLLLSFLGPSSSPANVWVPLILVGFGHGFFSPANVNSVISSVEPGKFGIASGMLGTIRTAGQSVGIAVLGGIMASQIAGGSVGLFLSTSTLPPAMAEAVTSGARAAFLVACTISSVGVFTSLLRGKRNLGESETR